MAKTIQPKRDAHRAARAGNAFRASKAIVADWELDEFLARDNRLYHGLNAKDEPFCVFVDSSVQLDSVVG